MNFPRLTLDINAYDTRLSALLNDEECLLFFDTNILAKMFSLHKGARDEFTAWVRSKKARPHERVVLPAWCLHEYSNRVIRNKLNSYVDVGKFIDEAQKLLPKLGRQLDMHVDDAAASRKGGRTRITLLQDLRAAQQAYLSLLPAADNSENTITTIHHEIVDTFSDCVPRSDIFELLKVCQQEYETRFGNNVPPGFRDVNKLANNLGDFVIWREIIATAVRRGSHKILYISDDQKLDWVYFPPKLMQASGRQAGGNNKNNGLVYPLIDPRLEYELALALTVEPDIMIISFEQLVNMLSQEDTFSFRLLAESVQEINRQRSARESTAPPAPEPEESLVDECSSTPEPTPVEVSATPVPEISVVPAQDSPTAEIPEPEESVFDELEFTYSSTALADATYTIPNSRIGNVIDELKSRTWDRQNTAIGLITKTLLNDASPDDLFVLGRNILQAATGSSFDAERFLVRFRNYTAKVIAEGAGRHLVNGLLYEVYFDAQNVFRGSFGKAQYLLELAHIIGANPYLIPCAEFIEAKLQPYGDLVLFIPYVREGQHKLTLSFRNTYSTISSDLTPILESCSIDNEVISNTIEEEQMIDSPFPQRNIAHYAYSLNRLFQVISLSRYIPFIDDFVQVSLEVDFTSVSADEFGDFAVPPNLVV